MFRNQTELFEFDEDFFFESSSLERSVGFVVTEGSFAGEQIFDDTVIETTCLFIGLISVNH